MESSVNMFIFWLSVGSPPPVLLGQPVARPGRGGHSRGPPPAPAAPQTHPAPSPAAPPGPPLARPPSCSPPDLSPGTTQLCSPPGPPSPQPCSRPPTAVPRAGRLPAGARLRALRSQLRDPEARVTWLGPRLAGHMASLVPHPQSGNQNCPAAVRGVPGAQRSGHREGLHAGSCGVPGAQQL